MAAKTATPILSLLQLLHAYVAVLDTLTVTEETDVTLLVEQAWVVQMVNSVLVVTTIWSYVVTLASLADVTLKDNLAINSDLDVVTLDADLLCVPLAKRTPLDTLCWDDTIYRTVYLVLAQASVDRSVVVQHLNLHTLVSSINTHRCADTYTVVYTLAVEAELKAEYEVSILLLCVEVTC
jgi:hypothetical protein